jgi:hypothetical protein
MTKTSVERVEAALEAAWLAHDNACPGEHWRKRARMEVAIKAYLSALSAADAVKAEPVGWLSSGPGWKRVFLSREAAEHLADGQPKATVTPLYTAPPPSELEALRKERDILNTNLVARAKTLLRLRDVLTQVHDHIEDEGDRVYFGSTNDAETLKDVWQELDGWSWDDIMSDGKLTDIFEISRKAHVRAETAEARLAELERAIRIKGGTEHAPTEWAYMQACKARDHWHSLAVSDDDPDEPSSYRQLAVCLLMDFERYAEDETPARRMVSVNGYKEDLERIDARRVLEGGND